MSSISFQLAIFIICILFVFITSKQFEHLRSNDKEPLEYVSFNFKSMGFQSMINSNQNQYFDDNYVEKIEYSLALTSNFDFSVEKRVAKSFLFISSTI